MTAEQRNQCHFVHSVYIFQVCLKYPQINIICGWLLNYEALSRENLNASELSCTAVNMNYSSVPLCLC